MRKTLGSATRLTLLAFLAACGSGSSGNGNGGSSGTYTGTTGTGTGSTGTGTGSTGTGTGSTGTGTGSTGTGNTGTATGTTGTGNTGTGNTGTTGTTGTGTGTTGTTGTGTGTSGTGTGTTGTIGTSGTSGTGDAGGGGLTATTLITSSPSNFWQTGTFTTVTSGTPTITVRTNTAQNWEGMGGAFNELGWKYIQMLSAADQASVLSALYGPTGANFNLGRIPMSASDYAIQRYSDDEVSSGMDLNLTSFSINEDKMYLIPYVQAAQKLNPNIRFWASPWTPPTWMKTFTGMSASGQSCAIYSQTSNITPTPAADTSPFDGGCMSSNTSILTTYGNFFVKWVQAYGQQNITIEAVSPQNEPNYPENYPSCLWDASLEATFIGTYLGPALKTAGLSTKVVAGTMSNNNSGDDPTNLMAIMNSSAAKGFIEFSGYQWGMEQYVSADSKMYNIPIWQTEHRCGNYPGFTVSNPSTTATFQASGAPNDITYGVETWELIRRWIDDGVTAYNAWNMVLDTVGKGIDVERNWPQDALITVDTSAKKFTLTPAYYAFKHVSAYAQPGGKVLNTTSTISIPSSAGTGGDEALAFQNPDKSITVVTYNPSSSAAMYTVSVGGKLIQFQIPGSGWATLVYVPS